MSIFILSKPIHSGKTTELLEWSKKQKYCSGILMPDVDGVRMMYDINSKILFEAECKSKNINNRNLNKIGKYYFFEDSFNKANIILENSLKKTFNWLVIDEVGKLELNNDGFYTSVTKSLKLKKENIFKGNILFVVRDTLLIDVIKYFEITNYKVVRDLIFPIV